MSSQLIKPIRSHDALLADISSVRASNDNFHLWWLGQSGFLLRWNDKYLLFDPYLSDSLTRKYAETEKPHIRMTELVIEPARLDFLDVVTSSHNHTDHLDGETLTSLLGANPQLTLVVPAANREFAADRLGVAPERLTALDAGQSIECAGFELHAVPAAHEALETDGQGRHRFVGYVVTFGGFAIYHSGDTVLYDGLVDTLRQWSIDVALLPINGSRPERKVPGNLWGREAVELAQAVEARVVIPCHYEMFTFNTVTTDEFVASAQQVGQNYVLLRCGERYSCGASE